MRGRKRLLIQGEITWAEYRNMVIILAGFLLMTLVGACVGTLLLVLLI